ncbi:STAS domain-containing protein [Streptomyces sp. NPDC001046]|uniref:STAS domain-containing protein n=1 Tax=Streptomyces sp. NPDC001046 TaxID=3364543 RepID=UPI00368A4131
MATESRSDCSGKAFTEINGEQATVTLSGDVSALVLRDLEALLLDPRLLRAERWVLDMQGVIRIELACAYALLRAVAEHSGTTLVRGARHSVQRTLRHTGMDTAAVIED